MKDTIHYQIGQQIGNFTISSYLPNESFYVLQCKCGNTSKGSTDHVTRKIANLLSEGYTACSTCSFEYQKKLKEQRIKSDTYYTYKDVYREYVNKSKSRDIYFELSLEEASQMFSQNCYYCAEPPKNKRTRVNGNTIVYQGIDRVDNSIGYTKENCVPCCKYCNSFKMERGQEDFFKHINKIYFNKVQRSASEEA
jgi:hypothetical protein